MRTSSTVGFILLYAGTTCLSAGRIDEAASHAQEALALTRRLGARRARPTPCASPPLQAVSETKRQPGHGAVNVFVTDVDALYQELRSRGARTLNEPKDYAYGMRDFDIHDLDGKQLCFGMESKQRR